MAEFMLVAYPTNYSEPASVLVEAVKGGDVPFETKVHAAYQVIGVGLGTFYPDSSPVEDNLTVKAAKKGAGEKPAVKGSVQAMKCGPDCCTDAEGLKALETMAASSHKSVKGDRSGGEPVEGLFSSLILQQAISFAMKLLQEWLAKKA